MECEEVKLKTGALIDSEINEADVPDMISHLESCYRCRNEYIELLSLQKRMQNEPVPKPPKEWFEELPHRITRRNFGLVGRLFFFLSYLLLLAFAFYSFFTSGEGLFVKLAVGGVVIGMGLLFGVTLLDRIKERKTDRYKGIMK